MSCDRRGQRGLRSIRPAWHPSVRPCRAIRPAFRGPQHRSCQRAFGAIDTQWRRPVHVLPPDNGLSSPCGRPANHPECRASSSHYQDRRTRLQTRCSRWRGDGLPKRRSNRSPDPSSPQYAPLVRRSRERLRKTQRRRRRAARPSGYAHESLIAASAAPCRACHAAFRRPIPPRIIAMFRSRGTCRTACGF